MFESAPETHDGEDGRIDVVSSSPVTSANAKVGLRQDLERIDALGLLNDDWDSYGALAVDPRAVEAAKQLLLLAADCTITSTGFPARPYAIAPLASGGVQLAWRAQQAELEVAVSPNGRASILLIHDPGEGETYVEEDDVPIRRVPTYFDANN